MYGLNKPFKFAPYFADEQQKIKAFFLLKD